ncbi:MAG: DUF975 family protein, partial [Clostridia bacterium]|nr:DUF975 family protein [Clostridia bacterium]
MINRLELKTLAKEQIKGNIGILFVIMLIAGGISIAATYIPIIGFFATFVLTPAFELSIMMIYLDMTRGIKPVVSRVFDGFYDLWSVVKLYLISGLFIFLWSLLFVIPGIIKSFSYSMAPFILAENKGMPALEAIRRSKAMMEGHKTDAFVLYLSFIGWMLLTYVTFGLSLIWVGPYIIATYTNFYNRIKREAPSAPEAASVVVEEPIVI